MPALVTKDTAKNDYVRHACTLEEDEPHDLEAICSRTSEIKTPVGNCFLEDQEKSDIPRNLGAVTNSRVFLNKDRIESNRIELTQDDLNLRDFMQNSNLESYKPSLDQFTNGCKVSFQLNELHWPSQDDDEILIQDLSEFPLDGRFCSTSKKEDGCVLHKEAINRQKSLLRKSINESLLDFIPPPQEAPGDEYEIKSPPRSFMNMIRSIISLGSVRPDPPTLEI